MTEHTYHSGNGHDADAESHNGGEAASLVVVAKSRAAVPGSKVANGVHSQAIAQVHAHAPAPPHPQSQSTSGTAQNGNTVRQSTGMAMPQSGRFHHLRNVLSLNGMWDFVFLGAVDLKSVSPDLMESAAVCQDWDSLPVPSAFDSLPAYAGKRGAAIYCTRFRIPVGRAAQIQFGAVSIWCRVWVDGELLAEHACGYAPFVVHVPAGDSAERELVVLVDNRFDFDRAPMHEPWFDFYQYGGIVRDVFLYVLPRQSLPWITGVYVTPELISSDSGAGSEGWVNVDISIRCNHAGRPELTDLGIEIDGTLLDFIPVREKSLQDEASDNIHIQARLKVPHARVWSPETPHLHTLRVILSHRNAPMDDFGVRFGLRTIEARDGALWLNGQRLVLKGFNRHEWQPGSGPCTSPLQMLADLQHLRAMGCNFIRGAHYPQDQRFLDLCDSLGFLVWEENLGWGQREKTFASTLWQQHHAATLEAMVRTSFNHPSVIIWGFLNEAGTNQRYTRDTIEACAALLRRLDPSRPITYASMFGLTDLHFDLVDIISLNTYPGWYGCEQVAEPLETIEPAIKELVEHLDASGHSAKPVLISEIGAEALYGWRDTHHDFFTEEYQAEYLRRACHAALGNPRCSGIALWHFSDIRTYSGGRSLLRPRTFNNKGVMDEYRRPKVAYGVVRQAFAELGTPSHATSCGK